MFAFCCVLFLLAMVAATTRLMDQLLKYPPSVTALKTGTNMFLDPIRLGVIGVFFKDRVYDGTRTIFST